MYTDPIKVLRAGVILQIIYFLILKQMIFYWQLPFKHLQVIKIMFRYHLKEGISNLCFLCATDEPHSHLYYQLSYTKEAIFLYTKIWIGWPDIQVLNRAQYFWFISACWLLMYLENMSTT